MSRHRVAFALLLVLGVGSAACDQVEDLVVKRPPGEKLYRNLCADCHGLDARGNTPQYMGNPNADLSGELSRGSDANSIEVVVREGIFGKMPAHDELTREQMRELLDHLKELRRRAQRPS